jgi:DNA invertase Pin-like site-specific DNA recombinase
MRVAIYARYSSEHQNERSIDDQVRLCREHAERQLGADIIGVYADYALSGSSLRNRPEVARLLTDAGARIYDAVLTEALDRLSRDQEDIAGIF